MKRRVLHKLKLTEISAVDRPAQEHALVTIMKRAPSSAFERRAQLLDDTAELLAAAKYNHSHDPSTGRFAAGSGGGGSTVANATDSVSNATGDGGTDITPAQKDEVLRYMQTSIRVAKIASWALVAPALISAFTAAAPVSVPFAITAALATLISRSALTKAAAFIAFDAALSQLIKYRERELAKAAPQDDFILQTLRAMRSELQRHKMKETTTMKGQDYYDSGEFQALVDVEIGRSGCPRHIGAQRVLIKYGSRPDVVALMKMRKATEATDDFNACVDEIAKRDGCLRTEALRRARRQHPDQFQAAFQES
jgi:hypothetical protein